MSTRRGETTWWAGRRATVVGHRHGRTVLRLDDGSRVETTGLDPRLGARDAGQEREQRDNLARLAREVLERLGGG